MPRKRRNRLLPPGPRPLTVPKAAVKLCPRGHRQRKNWKPGGWCWKCSDEAIAESKRAHAAVVEEHRRAWQEAIGPAPAVLEIRVVDTGRIKRFSIPPHLQKQRAARSRRPGRRRRV